MTIAMQHMATIAGSALDRLASEVAGPVLVPGDERYAEETAPWNLAPAAGRGGRGHLRR